MQLNLTPQAQAALRTAAAEERQVRRWRRYQAIWLLSCGEPPEAVARTLSCSVASVYNWAAAWRAAGLDGLQERPRGGRRRRLPAEAERGLDRLLETDPQAQGYQATGWTVPLLQTELAQAGYPVSQRTIRRIVQRRGWRWKRPKYVLGRPDPAYDEKKGP
jgi:transposase